MKVLWFAWLRDRTGIGEEEVLPPPEVATVADLTAWLRSRGPAYEAALADPATVRVAVDQDHAGPDTPVTGAAEVAFFPPVTGG